MHLLRLDNYPNFSLAEFADDEIPPYAILSHTWGKEGDEVTYKDIIEGTGNSRAGYEKLHFCANQATKDKLGYCWVDTCCIDKSNAVELTESINSMFRWYQNAVKCYVYLTDVSTSVSDDDTDSQLRNSRWFTRGWTLQELIAPRCVEFFTQDGEHLGDRMSLEKQINHITGISVDALRGEPLSHFTVDERMSWAANRTTKRPEDKVYSLFGIFDIHLEVIYGEGEHHARRRLVRELERYSENHQLTELFRDQLRLPSATPPRTPRMNPVWIVPFARNSRFTSREAELTRLEEMLFGKRRIAKLAIAGLGGVGKTQLVIELLYRIADKRKHCSAIWISAVNAEILHQSYLDAARQLGIPGCEENNADVKKLVQEHLSKESSGQWVLVFDNADDLDMWIATTASVPQPGQESRSLIDYLPKSKGGAIVFTTRDRKIGVKLAQQNIMDVSAMGEDASAELLKKCLINPDLVDSRQDTSALLSKLTFLPLAIVQATAYINENGVSLADYLLLLSEQEEEVIDLLSEEFEDDGRYRYVKNPVASTWLISFDQIRQRDELAADWLSFMACIEPKDIPPSLLPSGTSRKKEVDAMGTLTAYSFVHRRPGNEYLDLHRLVHLATRNWLRKEGLLTESTKRAILRLQEVFPTDDHENRPVWRKYLAHASYALESGVASDDEARTNLLWKLAQCLYEEGRWNEAERAYMQVLKTEKRVLGPTHSDTLTTMNDLAIVFRYQGRLDEAEELAVQVLETKTRVLGPEHTDTLTSIQVLAFILREKGRLDEAKELEVQVMEDRKRVLGPEHPDTLTSMHNLASTLGGKGRPDEAEELYVQVIEARKRVLGLEHPHTLVSLNNLSCIWKSMGKRTEALELMDQCVQLMKKVLGVNHPQFLDSSALLEGWRSEGDG